MTVPVDSVLIMYVCTFMTMCASDLPLRRFLSSKSSVCKSKYLDKNLLNTDKIQIIRYLYIIISYLYVHRRYFS